MNNIHLVLLVVPVLLLYLVHCLHSQERQQTHEAATVAAEESAVLSTKAMEYAAKMREEAYKERQRLAEEKTLNFSQKV